MGALKKDTVSQKIKLNAVRAAGCVRIVCVFACVLCLFAIVGEEMKE
jgi:hypothetical protein